MRSEVWRFCTRIAAVTAASPTLRPASVGPEAPSGPVSIDVFCPQLARITTNKASASRTSTSVKRRENRFMVPLLDRVEGGEPGSRTGFGGPAGGRFSQPGRNVSSFFQVAGRFSRRARPNGILFARIQGGDRI